MIVGYVLKHHEAVGIPQVLLQFLKSFPLVPNLGVFPEFAELVLIPFPIDHRTLHGSLLSMCCDPLYTQNRRLLGLSYHVRQLYADVRV